jgi:hypothetical protein
VEVASRYLAGIDEASGASNTEIPPDLTGAVDVMIDEAVARLLDSRNHRGPAMAAQQLRALIDRAERLEVVNAALQERLARERLVMATYVTSRWGDGTRNSTSSERGPTLGGQVHRTDEADQRLQAAEAEVERLHGEIDRIYATRTMRALRPARALYGRVRSVLR